MGVLHHHCLRLSTVRHCTRYTVGSTGKKWESRCGSEGGREVSTVRVWVQKKCTVSRHLLLLVPVFIFFIFLFSARFFLPLEERAVCVARRVKHTQALDGSPSPRVEFLRPLTAKKGLPQVGGPGSPYRLVDTFVYCVHFQTKKCCCCCCCCGKKHCYQVGARLGGDGVTCGCFCGATIQSEHHLTTCDTSNQPFSWQSFIATLLYSAVVSGY